MDIGQKIKELRIDHKLSQRKLAEIIGVSGQFISLIENGGSQPGLETLKKISKVLNVPVTDLLYPDEESKIAANDHIEKVITDAYYVLEESNLDLALKQILIGDFTDTNTRLSVNKNFKELFIKNYSREKLRNLPPNEFEKCFEETSLDIYEKAVIFAMIRDASITEFKVVNFYEYVNYIASTELSRPLPQFDEAYVNVYKRIGYNNAPTYMDEDLINNLIKKKYEVIKALNGVIWIIDGVESIRDTLMPGEYENIYYLFKNIESTIIAELSQKKDK